jgi:hypothetical protein
MLAFLVYCILVFYAGRLVRLILDLLYRADAATNRRAVKRQQAHSIALAEWLRESSQDRTGR